tara:strand:- start:28734 stop:28919 length:186 start_codon:yes stop_codon:yes gene_type:complete
MIYVLYDKEHINQGEFSTVDKLESYMDNIREQRNERWPNTPRMTTFDYIKSIGWFFDIKDT